MDYDAFRLALGARIRSRRADLGITQIDLAAATDMTQGAVSLIERGQSGCTMERMFRIAEALDTTIAALVPSDEETAAALAALDTGGVRGAQVLLQLASRMMGEPGSE